MILFLYVGSEITIQWFSVTSGIAQCPVKFGSVQYSMDCILSPPLCRSYHQHCLPRSCIIHGVRASHTSLRSLEAVLECIVPASARAVTDPEVAFDGAWWT